MKTLKDFVIYAVCIISVVSFFLSLRTVNPGETEFTGEITYKGAYLEPLMFGVEDMYYIIVENDEEVRTFYIPEMLWVGLKNDATYTFTPPTKD